jgi:hypothetical protein
MTPPLGGAISSITFAALSKNFFHYKAADLYPTHNAIKVNQRLRSDDKREGNTARPTDETNLARPSMLMRRQHPICVAIF